MASRRILATGLYYLSAFALPLIALYYILDLGSARMEVPFLFRGDTLENALRIKAFLEGSWSDVTRLSAPFSYNLFLFPVASHVDYAIACAFAAYSGEFGFGLMAGWLLKIMLGGLVSTWCFRQLGFSHSVAFVSGFLFALIPYALNKHASHYSLSIYLVPFMATICLLALRDGIKTLSRLQRTVFFGGAILIGFNGVYVAFFSCFMLCATIGMLCLNRSWRTTLMPALCLAIIVTATFLNHLPSLLALNDADLAMQYLLHDKSTPDMINENSLPLRELILPLPDHPIAAFRNITRTSDANFDPHTEHKHATLGLFGAVGFLGLIGAILYRLAFSTTNWTWQKQLLPAATLSLFCILLAVPHGFSNAVALYMTDTIRHYNRLCTYIGFYSFFATATFLEALRSRVVSGGSISRRVGWIAFAGLLCVLGAFDQTPTIANTERWEGSAERYDSAKELVQRIEAAMPPGAMIYQFPDKPVLTRYNLKGEEEKMVYTQLIPYLFSNSLRWSYEHRVGNDHSWEWHRRFNRFDADTKLSLLLKSGFDGVWIDKYDDEITDEFVEVFTSVRDAKIITSERGRIVFVDLTARRRRMIESMGQELYDRQRELSHENIYLFGLPGDTNPDIVNGSQ